MIARVFFGGEEEVGIEAPVGEQGKKWNFVSKDGKIMRAHGTLNLERSDIRFALFAKFQTKSSHPRFFLLRHFRPCRPPPNAPWVSHIFEIVGLVGRHFWEYGQLLRVSRQPAALQEQVLQEAGVELLPVSIFLAKIIFCFHLYMSWEMKLSVNGWFKN